MLEQDLIDAGRRFGMHIHRGMLRNGSCGLDWQTDGDQVKDLRCVRFNGCGDVISDGKQRRFDSIADALQWAIAAMLELKTDGKRCMVFPYVRDGGGGIGLEVAVYTDGVRREFVDHDGVFEAFLRGEIPHEVVFDWLTDNNHLAKQ